MRYIVIRPVVEWSAMMWKNRHRSEYWWWFVLVILVVWVADLVGWLVPE